MNLAEPGLCQNFVDDHMHGGDRCGEVDMNIRRRADRLGEQLALPVAEPRAAMGRAAVDSEIKRRASHAASPASQSVEHCCRGRTKRVGGFGRREPLSARPWRRLLGRHWQMHKDSGDRRPLVAEIL